MKKRVGRSAWARRCSRAAAQAPAAGQHSGAPKAAFEHAGSWRPRHTASGRLTREGCDFVVPLPPPPLAVAPRLRHVERLVLHDTGGGGQRACMGSAAALQLH